MRPRTAILTAALVAYGAFAGTAFASQSPTTEAKHPPPLFGFNDHAVQFRQVSAGQAAFLAAQDGARTARITVDWRAVESKRGTYEWGALDDIYDAYLALDIHPIYELAFAPGWARSRSVHCAGGTCNYPPDVSHMDDWRRLAAAVATRYPELAAIEIWNEPNLKTYWMSGPDPKLYARMVGEARSAVRAAGFGIPVVGGALSNYALTDSADYLTARTFLERMYAAGYKGASDGISVHPYPDDIDEWRFFKTLTELRDVRDAAGDTVPFMVTEIGTTTTGSTDNSLGTYGQAVFLPRLYQLLHAMPDVAVVIVHTLVEPAEFPAGNAERGYGVVSTTLMPKASYCALADVNGAGFVCPEGVISPVPNPDQERRWDAQELIQAAADAARRYKRLTGSYVGLSSPILHTIDARISPIPANGRAYPGPAADPSRVLVSVFGRTSSKAMIVCNASKSVRSYCVANGNDRRWYYGAADGVIFQAAGATTSGYSTSW